jgi:rhodanese-related sulfurtransferase
MKAKTLLFVVFLIFSTSFILGQNIRKINSNEIEETISSLQNNSAIIDGRSAEVFNKNHIINAINIDAFAEDAQVQISNYLDKASIVIYCTKQNRSELLSEMLSNLNYSGEIIILEDGFSGLIEKYPNSLLLSKNQKDVTQNLFIPSGKPIVQVFGNFDFNLSPENNQLFRFWIGRAHFGYQHSFNEKWQAKIIIDAGRPTSMSEFAIFDTANNLLNGNINLNEGSFYTMTLKFASLEWKPIKNLKLQAGSVLLNHYITQEKFWGYRYLAQTFQDKYYGLPSGDLGLIAYYTANEKLGIDFSLTNGEGFRKDQDINGNIKIAAGLDYFPLKSLQTRVYYEYYKSKISNQILEQQMLSAFIGYKFKESFRIGAEYNTRYNQQFIQNLDLSGFSVFGTYCLNKTFEFFARYDYLINANNTNSTKYPNLFAVISGFQYSPIEGINIGLNYQLIKSGESFSNLNQHALISFEYKF